MSNNTTVFRTTKIKSTQELNNKSKHCYDYTKEEIKRFKKQNIFEKPIYTLVGNKNNAYDDVKKLKLKNKVVERQNSCKAMESVFSTSKDFFYIDGEISKERVKIFTNKTLKFLKENFKGQIAHVVLHLHEETPHIHAFTVPFEVTNKRGRYECEEHNAIITKKYTPVYLSKLQNKYNDEFKEYSFKRVVKKKNKGVDRKTLKDHYITSIEENKKISEDLKVKIISVEKTNKELKEEIKKLNKVIDKIKDFFKVKKIKEFSKIEKKQSNTRRLKR